MILNNQFYNTEIDIPVYAAQYGTEGSIKMTGTSILSEHRLDVFINDVLTMRLICTADHLAELVVGRLQTEGFIHTTSEIRHLYICRLGHEAKVFLNRGNDRDIQLPYIDKTPTCCTGNRVINRMFARQESPSMLPDIEWKPGWVFHCVEEFQNNDMPIHRKTHMTHSCFLLDNGSIIYQAEDIGRHNAIDKAIGYSLLRGLDCSKLALFTSGRVPTDMVMKVINGGVPLLISKENPTREAIDLANQYHLILIGHARRNGFLVFSGGQTDFEDSI